MQPLFAVLQIADFATAVLTRGGRQPGAVAVITGEAPNQFVFSANEPARKGRIHEGMPLAEARSRFNFHGGGALTVLERDPDGGLVLKAGVMSIVLSGGEVKPGDAISIELPPRPHHRLEVV